MVTAVFSCSDPLAASVSVAAAAVQRKAKEAQAREACELVREWPEVWFFEKRMAKTGRLTGKRARLIAPLDGQTNAKIGGRLAGPIIEQHVR